MSVRQDDPGISGPGTVRRERPTGSPDGTDRFWRGSIWQVSRNIRISWTSGPRVSDRCCQRASEERHFRYSGRSRGYGDRNPCPVPGRRWTYHDLGLVITDEQHRFGVSQRTGLAQKGEDVPVLVMSATPIPRTLAIILYGELQVSPW